MNNRIMLLLVLLVGCSSQLEQSGTKRLNNSTQNQITKGFNWKIDSICTKEIEKTISKEFNEPMAIYFSDSLDKYGKFVLIREKKINDKYNGKLTVPNSEMGHWLILLGDSCNIKSILEQY